MMQNCNSITYQPNKLTLADLEQAVATIYHTPRPPRPHVIYVDSYGYESFNFLTSIHGLFPNLRVWMDIPRRVKGFIFVSFFQKHSLYKMKLYTDGRRLKYELIYGATLIGKSDSIETIRHFIRQKEQENGKGN